MTISCFLLVKDMEHLTSSRETCKTNLSDLAACSDTSALSLEDTLGFSWWSVSLLADFSAMVILSRETDLPPPLPPLEFLRSVLTDLSPSASLSTVFTTFCEPDTLSLSLSDPRPLSLSLSDPKARSRSLSSPELLPCSLSEPCSLSPALPGLSLYTPLSAEADRSFLPAASGVLLGRSSSEMLAAADRWSEVVAGFSWPDGALSEAAVSVLPFLPRSLFNLIFLSGFTWIRQNT